MGGETESERGGGALKYKIKMNAEHHFLTDDDVVHITRGLPGFRIICCDCGLEHYVALSWKRSGIEMNFKRKEKNDLGKS